MSARAMKNDGKISLVNRKINYYELLEFAIDIENNYYRNHRKTQRRIRPAIASATISPLALTFGENARNQFPQVAESGSVYLPTTCCAVNNIEREWYRFINHTATVVARMYS